MKSTKSSISDSLKTIGVVLVLFFTITPAKAQFTINNVFGNLTECDTMSRGIYLVWWDKDFEYDAQIDVLLDSMLRYRTTCLNNMGMMDPPNPQDGFYYNVYIHNPGNNNGFFAPYNWGNGQGTDNNGYPFLTLPNGVLNDWVNNAHETFHIFQYSANAPGFAYSGDSQWYIEASANWFAAKQNMDNNRAFIEAESLIRLPHVPLWLSFDNFPAAYPENWQRYVHQYALALQLYYLTDVVGISEDIITSGMYSGTTQKPQEYMYNLIGAAEYRQHFIDWAAHMTNDFDFISPGQALANEQEWNNYADPQDDNEYTEVYDNVETTGWYLPSDLEVTNAWSFNTFKLLNNSNQTYLFELNGNAEGSEGTSSYFQGKIVVKHSSGAETNFYDLNMTNDRQGSLSLELNPEEDEVYFIIASMPEVFEDNAANFQRFPYQMRISQVTTTAIDQVELTVVKKEIARYNLLGQPVKAGNTGLQIVLYNDGSSEQIYNWGEE